MGASENSVRLLIENLDEVECKIINSGKFAVLGNGCWRFPERHGPLFLIV